MCHLCSAAAGVTYMLCIPDGTCVFLFYPFRQEGTVNDDEEANGTPNLAAAVGDDRQYRAVFSFLFCFAVSPTVMKDASTPSRGCS